MPGKDGLLHISQISHERIAKVSDVLAEGQIVRVKVMETDEKGRVKLSMKALSERAPAPQVNETPSSDSHEAHASHDHSGKPADDHEQKHHQE